MARVAPVRSQLYTLPARSIAPKRRWLPSATTAPEAGQRVFVIHDVADLVRPPTGPGDELEEVRAAELAQAQGERLAETIRTFVVPELHPELDELEVPAPGTLVVLAKTEESFEFLDDLITELDQPSTVGIPEVIELKHANAVELADELNALLSEAGSGATIQRPGEGLGGKMPRQPVADRGDQQIVDGIDRNLARVNRGKVLVFIDLGL